MRLTYARLIDVIEINVLDILVCCFKFLKRSNIPNVNERMNNSKIVFHENPQMILNKSQAVSFDPDLRISQPNTLLDGLSLRENKSVFNARVRGAGSIPKFSAMEQRTVASTPRTAKRRAIARV